MNEYIEIGNVLGRVSRVIFKDGLPMFKVYFYADSKKGAYQHVTVAFPLMQVENNSGFSDEEVNTLRDYCISNYSMIEQIAWSRGTVFFLTPELSRL